MPNVTISEEQFQNLLTAIVQESRKPVVDPIKEKQRERQRAQNGRAIEDRKQMDLAKFRSCNHMQRGGVLAGCSAIAWATQSDGVRRGPCQHCGTLFSPIREECISDEVWEMYKPMARIPTHPGGDVLYTFQNA